MVAAYLLDISVFLSTLYMPEVYPYCWKLLEGHLSPLVTCLTDVHPIREGLPPRTLPLQSSLT